MAPVACPACLALPWLLQRRLPPCRQVNPETKFETAALGDANMRTLQKGDIIQLERKGYYIVDAPLLKPGKPIVLFSIPDGRAAKK